MPTTGQHGGITVTLKGDENLVISFENAADAVGDYTDTNDAAASMIEGAAYGETPVKTGLLRDSTMRMVSEKRAVVLNELDYAPVIHNGWPAHNIAPTPFLEEAWENTIEDWSKLYLERLKEIIDDIEGIP